MMRNLGSRQIGGLQPTCRRRIRRTCLHQPSALEVAPAVQTEDTVDISRERRRYMGECIGSVVLQPN